MRYFFLACLLGLFSLSAFADSVSLNPGQTASDIPVVSVIDGVTLGDTGRIDFGTDGFEPVQGTPLGSFVSSATGGGTNDLCSGCVEVSFGLSYNGLGGSLNSVTLNGFAGYLLDIGLLSAGSITAFRSADGDSITLTGASLSGFAIYIETNAPCTNFSTACNTQKDFLADLNLSGGNLSLVSFAPEKMTETGTLAMLVFSMLVCGAAILGKVRLS